MNHMQQVLHPLFAEIIFPLNLCFVHPASTNKGGYFILIPGSDLLCGPVLLWGRAGGGLYSLKHQALDAGENFRREGKFAKFLPILLVIGGQC